MRLTAFAGHLYLSAFTSATGRELYSFDGTELSPVADIHPGPYGSRPNQLTRTRDALYFVAEGEIVGNEIHQVLPDDVIYFNGYEHMSD